ncbi:MAG: tail fiber protein [Defluviicoccus sp.]|nr:tail fiber protein [Defluviicoccus sp.]
MTALTGKKPKDTYKDLLQVSNVNRGIDDALRPIEDGEGTPGALSLSTDRVSLGGNALVLDRDGDTSIAAADDDRIDVRLAGAVDFRFREDAFDVLDGSTLRLERGASLAVEDGASVTGLSGLSGLPAGMVAPFAGASAPAGWLLCHGQAVSRADYAALFAAIGETYGAGDGRTTFALPDLRGRAVAGRDDMGGTAAARLTDRTGGVDGDRLGAAGGAETHMLQISEMPQHSHTPGSLAAASAGAHTHGIGTADDTSRANFVHRDGNTKDQTMYTDSAGEHTHDVIGYTGISGNGRAHNNVQPTMVMNWIVKT